MIAEEDPAFGMYWLDALGLDDERRQALCEAGCKLKRRGKPRSAIYCAGMPKES